jgi:hypothetical protein
LDESKHSVWRIIEYLAPEPACFLSCPKSAELGVCLACAAWFAVSYIEGMGSSCHECFGIAGYLMEKTDMSEDFKTQPHRQIPMKVFTANL